MLNTVLKLVDCVIYYNFRQTFVPYFNDSVYSARTGQKCGKIPRVNDRIYLFIYLLTLVLHSTPV